MPSMHSWLVGPPLTFPSPPPPSLPPLRSTWEGGHRVFGIVAGPGVPAGSVTPALASTLDIFPTMASLAGVPLPSDRSYDGVDLSPVLLHGAPSVRDTLFTIDTSGNTPGDLTAVRHGNLTVYFQTNGQSSCVENFSPSPVLKHDPPLVFNLTSDPGETTPVPADPALVALLKAKRAAIEADIASTFRTTIDWSGGGRAYFPCCNASNVDCRCGAGPAPPAVAA